MDPFGLRRLFQMASRDDLNDGYRVEAVRMRDRFESGIRRKVRPAWRLGPELLEARQLLSGSTVASAPTTLTTTEVTTLIDRAVAASSSNDAIIVIVDRAGDLLAARVEGGVSPAITGSPEKLTFAIDGALAKARTGGFFGNNQAPLTSRTVQLISQSTMLQREVQSDPNLSDPNSTQRGPGFVAPVGIKGHFPPGVQFTPQVDLFNIEASNRDSLLHPNREGIKHIGENVLPYRFNIDPKYVPPGQEIRPPESYGFLSGIDVTSQSRGLATLPGGIPIFKGGNVVGGIGIFFPGTTGYATEENSSLNSAGFYNPKKRDRSMEAEYMAFVAVGGVPGQGLTFSIKQIPNLPPLDSSFGLPFGRIDLVGISLDLFGGHGLQGPANLLKFGSTIRPGLAHRPDQIDEPVNILGDKVVTGQIIPDGWLVAPHDGNGLSAQDVTDMVTRGIAEANQIRAAIRTPLDTTTKMTFAVTDRDGQVLGLYRMPDGTVFSIDVAVAKARNVAYYANASQLQPGDQLSNVPAGIAFTSRTFRYLALPHFPEGIDTYPAGPFSILRDPGALSNGRIAGTPQPASAYQSAMGYDAFRPETNFRDSGEIKNQNGVIFFPGSSPLYKDVTGTGQRVLVGGLGVSGDGVDQDDDVTFTASTGYQAPEPIRADRVIIRGVRLPYNKSNRQPHEPLGQKPEPPTLFKSLPLPGRRRSGSATTPKPI